MSDSNNVENLIQIKSNGIGHQENDLDQVQKFIRIKWLGFATFQFDQNHKIWVNPMIRIKHVKSQNFMILKVLWDFTLIQTQVKNTKRFSFHLLMQLIKKHHDQEQI